MRPRYWIALFVVLSFIIFGVGPSLASDTPQPSSVNIPGSFQSELGCPGDWDPACANTQLTQDPTDGVWQGVFTIPAGYWEYKAALNGSWDENYGVNATRNGANIPLTLPDSTAVKFYYDHETHWIVDNWHGVIAIAPGSFQSELGCPGDWQPDCLRSWLQDPDGDEIYVFETSLLPPGDYEMKIAINESWEENYGQDGVRDGANIPFTIPEGGAIVRMTYDHDTHIPTVEVLSPQPTVTLVGSLQSELGCPGDWDPACAATYLVYDANDDVYQRLFSVPAGSFEYKVAINNSWAENYGRYAQRDGANIPLALGAETGVKFYYDPKTHWITDNQRSVIAVAPGSFQSELGCSGDWDPGCLRSWLQDPDEDGIYIFETTALPAGSYEAKVALNESWDVNYGQGGVQNGANIPFAVPFNNARVTFRYDSATHVLTILSGFRPDNDVAWDGLRHDSRDPLYRKPGGAAPAGTPVILRLRTFHNDVTGVTLRVYDLNANAQRLIPMSLAAADVACYQPGLEQFTCDFWAAVVQENAPNNLWYRFIVSDGSDTDYYADNTPALDGGLGRVTDDAVDHSWALMFYDPAFAAPDWVNGASLYQIFPDRFRSGRANNDPKTGDVRYDDPVLKLPWGVLPEGYCRNYSDAATNCPWRFDTTPPDWSPLKEAPRGRDYFGGDLKGVDQYLDYLQSLGVTTLYFNPIFDAASNHAYDTQDYYRIDPYFGTQKDWENLVKHAEQFGMRIILDGVFNHLSSDSPFFDRYHHYPTLGACESLDSPYRDWFYFHDVAPGAGFCVDSQGRENSATYDGWFGFDSIPVINKSLPEVQEYFLTGVNSVSRYWLAQGASGWRLDVMGDPSFPAGYWETFRGVVKGDAPDALIIGELWQKDSTLLRFLRGDRADTTMNYRLRDAILGLLAPQPFDSKGFADSGRILTPSEFAARLESIREDYPDAAYYSLMNLLDSHDTERILWTLTPGAETRAEKEFNSANLAEGKQRLRIASLIQFTVPGVPTVFYGDEVGMTGDDDPDDRRTYPWADRGGSPDSALFAHYQALNALRRTYPVLVYGDFRMLLADDASQVVAYGRKSGDQAAIVIVNRSSQAQSGAIPVAGYLPDGLLLSQVYAVGEGGAASVEVSGGVINGSIGPLSAVLLVAAQADLTPPEAPAGLRVITEGADSVSLVWDGVPGAAGYNVYRSPLSGGGWVKVNLSPVSGTEYTDAGLETARPYFYIVTALDEIGNESKPSNEVSALPHYTIGWANLQWPPMLNHTISAVNRTANVYGQVWIDGVTNQPGPAKALLAQLGFGPEGTNPQGHPDWVWVDASFNVDVGNNDEFVASLLPEAVGVYDYVYRYSTTNGRDWLYADLSGPIPQGAQPSAPGKLTVVSSGDLTPPSAPANLTVASATPVSITLTWDLHPNPDGDLAGFEIYRDGLRIARVYGAATTMFIDPGVTEGVTYSYYVIAFDASFNRSAPSNTAIGTAVARTVSVTFNVTVPSNTPPGSTVYIAGTLNRLDGNLPEWNPGATSMTQAGPLLWTITLTGKEGVQIEYKYTLGSWDYVEKGATCEELANRMLTLSYGSSGTQVVNDTVLNWRNIAPCGN